MDKIVYFAFNGNPMCFTHVLLNVLDMDSKGIAVKLVIEGEAVKLVQVFEESQNPLYLQLKQKNLIDGICKACSAKLGALEYNSSVGIPLKGDMMGHPAMAPYAELGYTIITL